MSDTRHVVATSLERLKAERDRAEAERLSAQARVDAVLLAIGQGRGPLSIDQLHELESARLALDEANRDHALKYTLYMGLVRSVLQRADPANH